MTWDIPHWKYEPFLCFFLNKANTQTLLFLIWKSYFGDVVEFVKIMSWNTSFSLFTWFEVCWLCVLYRMLAVKNKLIVADPESQRLLHTTLWLLRVPACVWVCVCVSEWLLYWAPAWVSITLFLSQLTVNTVSLVPLQTSKPPPSSDSPAVIFMTAGFCLSDEDSHSYLIRHISQGNTLELIVSARAASAALEEVGRIRLRHEYLLCCT